MAKSNVDRTPVCNISPSPDAARFIRLCARGLAKEKAKIAAGYSKHTNTRHILQSKEAQQIKQAIEAQRIQSVNTPGQTLTDCVEVAQEIRDNPFVKPNVQLQANRQIVDINGYDPRSGQPGHPQSDTMRPLRVQSPGGGEDVAIPVWDSRSQLVDVNK